MPGPAGQSLPSPHRLRNEALVLPRLRAALFAVLVAVLAAVATIGPPVSRVGDAATGRPEPGHHSRGRPASRGQWSALSFRAASGLDGGLLAQTESEPLLTIDEADFSYRRQEDKPYEGLIEDPGEIDVFVPRQTSYPAQFLTRIGSPGTSTSTSSS